MLYANTLHDQLFGAVQVLGTPALEAFPHLAPVGILAVIETLDRAGQPTATAPIPLSEPATGSVIFAAVPVRVPGHASAVLTLGLRDSDGPTVLSRAAQIAADIGGLTDPSWGTGASVAGTSRPDPATTGAGSGPPDAQRGTSRGVPSVPGPAAIRPA